MKSVLVLFSCMLMLPIANGQSFSDFISAVNNTPETERQAMVDGFLDTVSHIPYTEFDTLAHFVFKGSAATVSIA